jgi:hypothetical protein
MMVCAVFVPFDSATSLSLVLRLLERGEGGAQVSRKCYQKISRDHASVALVMQ